jgi:hypothetical protein
MHKQVVRNRLTTMLPANNVIDFMRKPSVILMKQAIFAPEASPATAARSSAVIFNSGRLG